MPKKKILFLVPYPLHRAPSQRFRVELFLPAINKAGISYKIESFLDAETWAVLYSNASAFKKAFGVFKGFLKRSYIAFFVVPQYNYIFIHREASPVGPPVFEFIITKLWRKKIIYDFDDAIWIPNTSQENKIFSWIKAVWKIKHICSWSYKVVVGNQYLCNYVRQYNNNVVLIPTCVDTKHRHNLLKQHTKKEKVIIGWTGSHSTLQFLNSIYPVIKRLEENFDFEMLVICNRPPEFTLRSLKFLPWVEKTEIDDLLQIDIGIMPLEPDAWSEGKCGFKLIQYLALGIPAVASPVGVNKEIIDDSNGFLCITEEEWYTALTTLIQQETLRASMGRQGRKKIREKYSLHANEASFLALFA